MQRAALKATILKSGIQSAAVLKAAALKKQNVECRFTKYVLHFSRTQNDFKKVKKVKRSQRSHRSRRSRRSHRSRRSQRSISVRPPKNKRQQNGEYYIPTSGLHQYTHVKYPQVFEWGYRRGDPLTHVRSQVFNQQGSSFNSAVRMIFTRQFLFVFTLNLKIEVCSRQNFSCCFISKPFREFRALFCFFMWLCCLMTSLCSSL